MMDFFFFVKTLLLTMVVVLLLQIQIGQKTVEMHVHDWVEGSVAAGFLGHAAHGGAHFLKDATRRLGEKMKANIGLKHHQESSETKASRFHWEWGGDTKKKTSSAEDVSDTD